MQAVSFVPLVDFLQGGIGDALFDVRVFDSTNTLIGSSPTVFPGAGNSWTKNGFVGIVATGGDDIGRVTLYNNGIRQGVDDVTAYGAAVPEPSTVGLMGLGCLLLGWMRSRKKAA